MRPAILRRLVVWAAFTAVVFGTRGVPAQTEEGTRPTEPTKPGGQVELPAPTPKRNGKNGDNGDGEREPQSSVGAIPEIAPPPKITDLAGRPINRIEIESIGRRWREQPTLRFVRVGDLLTLELARRAMLELTDTGRFANVSADAERDGDGVILRLRVVPQRIVASVRIVGGVLDAEETLRIAELHDGNTVTDAELSNIEGRVRGLYIRRGYPIAQITTDVIATDDPTRVVVTLDIQSGDPRRISRRRFLVWPDPKVPGMRAALYYYKVEVGDRADDEELVQADKELEKELRIRGWHRATVGHSLVDENGRAVVKVDIKAGPLVRLKFEGLQRFDDSQLVPTLELDESDDRTPATLVERVKKFYIERGFLDVEITVEERGKIDAPIHDLVFRVREGQQIQIASREYPCLTGPRDARDVGSEIDSFLTEQLPGSGFLSSVDPRVVDQTLGPGGTTGARPVPFEPNPWKTYVPDVYERAMKHVQDLYRSEGYLSATVGPAELIRRRCSPRSPPGHCIPIGPRRRPKIQCVYDEIGLPVDEPPADTSLLCLPDPKKGVTCEPGALLHVPIKLGPRTFLYDLAFEGNRVFTESALAEATELELGEPASFVELEKARRRVLDTYAEEGFAFAEVDANFDFSPDHTRGRARFTISEREQVRVSRIVIKGARRTNEGLIRSRVALKVGQPYRRSDVRKTEERLATLGVFSNITVGFEDPYIPAREKVVVITLVERLPQFAEPRAGFSTGEGFRVGFEYAHRNIAGEAIQFTLQFQLSYLPNGLILERDVREKYEELTIDERLEGRVSARMEFPEVGLGPLFRFSVEGLFAQDNARDFGLTKGAGIVTLTYRPTRQFSTFIGASLERNTARIFGAEQKDALKEYVTDNPRSASLFRVPEGTTIALAERIGFSWDRRDVPLGATKGTLFSSTVEHVRSPPFGALPASESGDGVFDPPRISQFLRYTNRIGGYVRLSDKGLSLAGNVKWGFNQQLVRNSRTYPDRLFFMGGVDSMRGFLQDSLIPEDIAQELLHPDPASPTPLTLREVVIRGGDAFFNPRLELRVPVSGNVQTAIFVDTGNLWRDPKKVNPLRLRYSAGSGLRVGTPIGPLVFDYGFNIERVLDEIYPDRPNQRFWEEIGAFHFSIGLF